MGTAEARVASLWAAPDPAPVLLVEDIAADPRAPLNAANDDASCAPEGWSPVGCASVDEPALATTQGATNPPGITPFIMACACSH